MNKKNPKPSEIIEAVYDFCEEEKTVENMTTEEVAKALNSYGIKMEDAISRVQASIAKVKAKELLRDASADRSRRIKAISEPITNVIKSIKDATFQISNLFGIQPELAFRNFNGCPDQDLTTMAQDLAALDGNDSVNASSQLGKINPKAAAYRLTQRFFISEPKEIELEAIAMALGVLVVNGPLQGCEARLLRRGMKGIIRASEDLTPGQRRFAIAHELGHWEMHSDISQWYLCTNENIASYNSSPQEIQASAFAAEFLMPTGLFRPLCEEVEPRMELIRQLANDFQTGLTATALRFIELNENPCMVVLSDGKRIRWWRKNDGCENAWFQSKQEIGAGALAVKSLNGEKSSLNGDVPYSSWFSHIETDNRDTIFEQSIKLGRYNAVLTLLWFD